MAEISFFQLLQESSWRRRNGDLINLIKRIALYLESYPDLDSKIESILASDLIELD